MNGLVLTYTAIAIFSVLLLFWIERTKAGQRWLEEL